MPHHILIVDDDKAFREELRECLYNYQVALASNGEEAIGLISAANETDLIILDVMMPGLTGTEVLKKIKKLAPEVRIIVLTGFSSKDIAIEALKGKADDYLEKPVGIEKLKETIEKLLESKGKAVDADSEDTEGKIDRIKHYVARNWHQKITLGDAAARVALSPKYLSRIFSERVGMTYSEFCIDVKISKAQEMLDNTGYNIDQVSDKIGYKNAESFVRIFKKRTGFTPTEYRSKKQKRLF
jgi:YesN/AraC family two-component response regulator